MAAAIAPMAAAQAGPRDVVEEEQAYFESHRNEVEHALIRPRNGMECWSGWRRSPSALNPVRDLARELIRYSNGESVLGGTTPSAGCRTP